MPGAEQPKRQSWLTTLGWACYLACSWTWCIGMFLPVLLVRDFGLWGFVVFAVPNVVGAATMGWVLRRPGSSEHLAEAHRPAIRVFSAVTTAFQIFFLFYVFYTFALNVDATHRPQGALLLLAVLAATLITRGPWLAVLITAASVALFILYLNDADAGWRGRWPHQWFADRSVLWLGPVCAFGFLLCPYLDATFHRARQALDARSARWAFGLGFGVVFTAMILFTLSYSMLFERPGTRSWPYALVYTHFLIQCAYTIGVHLRPRLPALDIPDRLWTTLRISLLTVVALVAFGALALTLVGKLRGGVPDHMGSLTESVYRCFIAFYGLVFPAYVWLCMIPTRDGHSGTGGRSGRRKLAIWASATIIAAPAFWMGFIERQTWWLVPGLAVVLLARLLVPRSGGGGREEMSPTGIPSGSLPRRPLSAAARASEE